MSLRHHEIAEAGHRILNPLTDDKLRLLGEVCRLREDLQQLDLACGKGEMLSQWARRHGIGGVGVDISSVFLASARARAAALGVADRLRFELADAADWVAGRRERYDVVSCIGATWIGGGARGTVELMLTAVRPGGLLLVGEPFWNEEPPEPAYSALGFEPGGIASLSETCDRLASAGPELVEMVLADEDSWDRYVAAQWWTISQWLSEHPDDPEAPAMREFLDSARASHLQYGRRHLGWGVFVLRAG